LLTLVLCSSKLIQFSSKIGGHCYLVSNQYRYILKTVRRQSDLCSAAEADDGDASASSVDFRFLNHVINKAEHVLMEIVVIHVACRVDQEQHISLLPARVWTLGWLSVCVDKCT